MSGLGRSLMASDGDNSYVNMSDDRQSSQRSSSTTSGQSPVARAKAWVQINRKLVVVSLMALLIMSVIVIAAYYILHKPPKKTGPCYDFYQWSCQDWFDANPLRSGQSYNRRSYDAIALSNENTINRLLTQQLASLDPSLQTFYRSCMDYDGITGNGLAPLLTHLAKLNNSMTWDQYLAVIGLWRTDFRVNIFMHVDVEPSSSNSSVPAVYMMQGGLSLDSPSDYTSSARMVRMAAEIAKVFTMLGDSQATAASNAAMVVSMERTLAAAYASNYYTWDTRRVTNWTEARLFSGNWTQRYIQGTGVQMPQQSFTIDIYTASYFQKITQLFNGPAPTSDMIQYARWRLVNESTPFVPTVWGNNDWRFDPRREFTPIHKPSPTPGVIRMEPVILTAPTNWARYCRQIVDLPGLTNDLLGQAFMSATFNTSAQAYVRRTAGETKQAWSDWTPSLTWADNAAVTAFNTKMNNMKIYIGGSPVQIDYAALTLSTRGLNFFENARQIRRAHELYRWSAMQDAQFDMVRLWDDNAAATVNAYYHSVGNAFFLFAGFMQSPFFVASSDPIDIIGNYAWLEVIGHEMGHGFDLQGLSYNITGSYDPNWLSKGTQSEFEQGAICAINKYNQLSLMGVSVDGRNTLGENLADLVGARLAHHAYQSWLANYTAANPNTAIAIPSNFQPAVQSLDQYFWTKYGQRECMQITSGVLQWQRQNDVHAPSFARVNGPAMMNDEFGAAFNCDVGSDMRPKASDTCFVY